MQVALNVWGCNYRCSYRLKDVAFTNDYRMSKDFVFAFISAFRTLILLRGYYRAGILYSSHLPHIPRYKKGFS